jgi:hypothetical protein
MNRSLIRYSFSVVLWLLAALMTANAQEFRGSITGKVTDPTGAVLPGATVTVKNAATNVENTTTTNGDGDYNFPLLQPGRYNLTVNAQGFAPTVREGIEVKVADKLTLDVQVQVSSVGETVTTVASTETLDTGKVETGTTVTDKQISELPLVEGSAYQLATLAPGVVYNGNPQFYSPTSNSNLAAFRSNGATGANQITLDGSPNYGFSGVVGFSPPADAVQEFKVQTNSFDAQQGYSAGATVNVAIKSGTNDPHGTVYLFNRDRSRTANNFFSNRAGIDRPARSYYRYGGTIGAPIYIPKLYDGRNRTFFFFAYERIKDNVAEPQFFTVPTLAERNGDFSALLNLSSPIVIYDPATAKLSGSNVVRTAFPGNIIPANRINPISAALLKFIPLPNVPGNADGTQNYFSNMNRLENYRSWLIRVDHKISENQTLFGKFYHSFNPEDRYNWAGIVNNFPVTQGFENRTNNGGNLDYTRTLSPTSVLDVRVSLNQFEQRRLPAATIDPSQLGFSGAALAAMRGYQYFPDIIIRNFNGPNVNSLIGANRSDFNLGLDRPFYMASLQPTLTKTFGNHTARVGYDLRVLRENFISNGYQGGRFFFDGTYTSPASNSSSTLRNAVGRDLAAFLLGIPSVGSGSTASQIDNPTSYSVQSIYHGAFVQDDWRITPKLTLNLGLRYEVEQGVTERYNRLVRGFDLTTPNPLQAAAQAAYAKAYAANPSLFQIPPDQFMVLGGYTFADNNNRGSFNPDTNNFQPRFGISYQVNAKTVLRGGFGIFMAPFQIETPIQTGFSSSTAFVPTTNNGLTFTATLSNPFPSGVAASPGSSLGLLTNVGRDVGTSSAPVIPVDRKNAEFARLIIGIQRELPHNLVIEANYVSSWGYDLPVTRQLNFVPRQYLGTDPTSDAAANTFLSTAVPNPFAGLLPGTSLNGSTIARSQLLVAYPEFTNLFVQQYNGSNRYNALQLQASERFTRDLTFNVTYTRSRLRERVSYLSPSDTALEDRLSTDDRPNRFTLAAVYVLPIGRGRLIGNEMNRFLDYVIGGWQLNGTYEWQSGEPLLLTAQNIYFNGDITQIKSRVGQHNSSGQIYGIDIPAFDTSNFVRLSSFGIRNVPSTLDNLRNQPFSVANLSISKNFRFNETKRLAARIEALNAFNHPYFGNGLNLDPSSASFGFVNAQRNLPRDIQLGLKFYF